LKPVKNPERGNRWNQETDI